MAPFIAGRHCRRIKCLSFSSQSQLFVLFFGCHSTIRNIVNPKWKQIEVLEV